MLRLDGVSYRYAGAPRDALTDVSLSVGPREFHAVLGPNGSGKTTLVRIALGALVPLVGRADVIGRSASSWPRRDLAKLVGVEAALVTTGAAGALLLGTAAAVAGADAKQNPASYRYHGHEE